MSSEILAAIRITKRLAGPAPRTSLVLFQTVSPRSHCRRPDRTARIGNCNLGAPAIAPIAGNALRSRQQAEPLLVRCPWLFSLLTRVMRDLSSLESVPPVALRKSVLYDPLK